MENNLKKDEIILITDQRILDIKIKENHEKMIDLKNQSEIIYNFWDQSSSNYSERNENYTKMRQTLYLKLIEAQKLLPNNVKFCLYEAYRNVNVQTKLFNERFEKIKLENPHWEYKEIFIETTKFVSPVTNLDGSKNITPHSTGAAIDLFLVNNENEVLDMGVNLRELGDKINEDQFPTYASSISEEAKYNRMIMGEALSKVGLVNYPTEFWHWSYGDKYWAHHIGEEFAIYDSWNDEF